MLTYIGGRHPVLVPLAVTAGGGGRLHRATSLEATEAMARSLSRRSSRSWHEGKVGNPKIRSGRNPVRRPNVLKSNNAY